MFLRFFATLRAEGVGCSLSEFLSLLQALQAGIGTGSVEDFYHIARAALVKDERRIDRFDRAFSICFQGVESLPSEEVLAALDLPADWLRHDFTRHLSEEERAALEGAGSIAELMERLRQRLAEQKERHAGGNKWVGTGGTSAFGAYGYNPAGVRIGQDRSIHRRAVKVWDRRDFRDYDAEAQVGPRNLQIALRSLRAWARAGAAEELDLPETIRATARQGWLDVQTRPERQNAVKVLLFLDVGGSMDDHVHAVEALFAAARAEFRHLEVWHFHNCLYEGVWKESARRWTGAVPTWDLLNRYGADWRAVFVGDAAMSPWEIEAAGGAVEHWNAEPGRVWLERACTQWPRHLWINPLPEAHWSHTQSVGMIRRIFSDRMVPMTLEGIASGTKGLR